jgi:hypothetical protein
MIRGIHIQTHRAPLFWHSGIGVNTLPNRQQGDIISFLSFFEIKKNRLKMALIEIGWGGTISFIWFRIGTSTGLL